MSQAKKFVVRMETVSSRFPAMQYTQSMLQLWDFTRLPEFNDIWLIPPTIRHCSDIPLGRNLAIEHDLTQMQEGKFPEWDVWLWIDDDHAFEPEVILSLVDAVKRGAVDIVSPLVGHKGHEHAGQPVVYDGYDEALGLWNRMYTGWEKPDLYEVFGVGTGFMMITREVFEKMPKPWFERARNPHRRDMLHGNDLHFCYKAKKEGFRVWLDSRTEIGHVNSIVYWPRKHWIEEGRQEKALAEQGAQNAITPSKKEDINTVSFWDTYYEKHNWQWREDRTEVMDELMKRIPDESSVLHFGCGEGWFLQQIQERGENISVYGIDQSGVAIALCRNRGIECKAVGPLAKYDGDGPERQFDYILITDWLERLPNPEETINFLAGVHGHEKTQLLVVAPDATLPPHKVPEHHHLFSQFNLGELMSRFGRPLEIVPVKETVKDTGGQVVYEIPRLVSRSTLEKVVPHGVSAVV